MLNLGISNYDFYIQRFIKPPLKFAWYLKILYSKYGKMDDFI